MAISPYLFFNGTCREALGRYGDVFGSTAELMDASNMPPEYQVPPERQGWIMHGTLAVAGGTLMASDNITGTADPMAGASISISFATAAEAKAIFDQLADGGDITMPWTPTFWSAGFGMLTDRFGVRWMITCEQAPG